MTSGERDHEYRYKTGSVFVALRLSADGTQIIIALLERALICSTRSLFAS
jgi:hypothetical protein